MAARQPDLQEMQAILAQAAYCLECEAPECHETTPEGVDVCAELRFWNGRPVERATLLRWQELVQAESAGRG